MEPERSPDLVRTIFRLLALGGLIAASVWIIRPFLMASLWATTVAIATWPLFLQVQSWLGGRRRLAVAVMTALLMLTLVAPLYFATTTIVETLGQVSNWSKALDTFSLPQPPIWITTLPMVVGTLASHWQEFAAIRPEELSIHLAPFARKLGLCFLIQVGNLGLLLIQCVITLIIVAILYANGETAGRSTVAFLQR